MIRVMYYGSRQELTAKCYSPDSDVAAYGDESFTRLMCGENRDDDFKPFRDAESRKLFDVFGISIVEEERYSVRREGHCICMSALDRELKYALFVTESSRNGKFVTCEHLSEEIWGILREMPFDILIAASLQDFGWLQGKLPIRDYVIVNYPYNGGIEVNVTSFDPRDGFYTPVRKGSHEDDMRGHLYVGYDGEEDFLYIGKDGRYYTNDVSLQFYWRRHLDEILSYIDGMKFPKKIRPIEDEYNIFDFMKLIEPCIIKNSPGWGYWDEINMWKKFCVKEGNMTRKEFRDNKRKLRASETYEDYLYFRDTFKIINHMYLVPPKEMNSRRTSTMAIQMFKDGRYFIGGGISEKYIWQEEILGNAVDLCSSDCDTLLLYVDVEEIMNEPADLDKTEWCILCHEDSIELFDKWDGLRLFAVALRAALASGRCEISRAAI